MRTINQEQLEVLRTLKKWVVEKQVAQNNLKVAERELNNCISDTVKNQINPDIIDLVMYDNNGSGVKEILEENQIAITDGQAFEEGDRVEHARRGKGTFLTFGVFDNESVVEFDEDSDARGETLTVSTGLLKKLN